MQHIEFEPFCKVHKKAISHIKENLEKIYASDPDFCLVLSPFCQLWEKEGAKKFVFLFSALFKHGADYIALNNAFEHLLTLLRISSTYLYTYKIELENHERYKLTNDILNKLSFMPLIVYNQCDYEEMQTWFDAYHLYEPNNQFVQMIERRLAYNKFQTVYHIDEWTANGGEEKLIKDRNAFLNLLADYANAYPELEQEVNGLSSDDFQIQNYTNYLAINTKPLHDILLKVNQHHLDSFKIFHQMAGVTKSVKKYYTNMTLFNNWKVPEVAIINDYYKPHKCDR